jgi:chaperonin GroES
LKSPWYRKYQANPYPSECKTEPDEVASLLHYFITILLQIKIDSFKEATMIIKPVNNRVLIKKIEDDRETSGGIIIPDIAKEKTNKGEIIAVGPGKRSEKCGRIVMEVKKGDRIIFSKYGGTEIKIDGEEHLFLKEDDILGIIE